MIESSADGRRIKGSRMEVRVATDTGDRGVFEGLSENSHHTDNKMVIEPYGKLRFPAISP